jgi:YD repeat-containing protein
MCWTIAGRGEVVAMFHQPSWRNGTICLYARNDRVQTVAWVFSPISFWQRRLRDGGLINFSYDALMRVIAVDAPSGANDVSYAYDNFSRLTQSVAGGQTLSFAYDQLSRLTSAGGPLAALRVREFH